MILFLFFFYFFVETSRCRTVSGETVIRRHFSYQITYLERVILIDIQMTNIIKNLYKIKNHGKKSKKERKRDRDGEREMEDFYELN